MVARIQKLQPPTPSHHEALTPDAAFYPRIPIDIYIVTACTERLPKIKSAILIRRDIASTRQHLLSQFPDVDAVVDDDDDDDDERVTPPNRLSRTFYASVCAGYPSHTRRITGQNNRTCKFSV